MSRIVWLAALLFLAPPVMAMPRDITIRTSPPGATITVLGPPDRVLGKTGEILHLDVPSSPNEALRLRL
ncbi:MAG TPA: hypothetical protein VGO93_07370, partial [Candidatus Xenobia bacterium]